MRLLKALFFLALVVAGVLFAVSNRQDATVRFFSFFQATYPLYIVLLSCFAAGTLAGVLFVFVSAGAPDGEREINARLAALEDELAKARGGQGPQGQVSARKG